MATSTTYHFRVRSKDSSGNQSVSEDYNFTIGDPHSSTSTSDIVLNEILPNPVGDDRSLTGLNGEWVEIYNKTANQLDLAGWYIKDAANHQIIIQGSNTMSSSTIIGANGSGSEWLVVFMDNAILNNNTGDTVTLYDKNNTAIDSYSYTESQVAEGKSIARYPDGSDIWYDPIPTPGEPNKLSSQE